jgi:superfamily II DNA or RNA helicase
MRDNITNDIFDKIAPKGQPLSSTIYAGTGVGKTRIAIKYIQKILEINPQARGAFFVPKTSLRDYDIPDEFLKWDAKTALKSTTILCYASIQKLTQKLDYIILDEAHNITVRIYSYMLNLIHKDTKVLCLTATKPRDAVKVNMIELLAPVRAVYSTQKAISNKAVAPFEIHYVYVSLNNLSKNVKVEYTDKYSKITKHFYTTEFDRYTKLSDQSELAKARMFDRRDAQSTNYYRICLGNRARFLYNLPSKTEKAKQILLQLTDKRVVVFSKSIDQIEQICANSYHSKKKNRDAILKAFNNEEIKMLGCVDALNEGKNLTNVDTAVIVSLDSNPKNIIQRIGRVIRFKEDKVAKIYIIVARGTRDEHWVRTALKDYADIPTFHHNTQ